MKIVRGYDAARRALCEGRGLGLDDATPAVSEGIRRVFGEPLTPLQVAERIVREVRRDGDAAVRRFTRMIDGDAPDELEVDAATIADARRQAPAKVVDALEAAADRIRAFHEAALNKGWMDYRAGYGQIVNAVERAGAYVPGGTALYPSTVLMTAIPARVAGVSEVVMCTPAKSGERPNPAVLAAAAIAGVDRVFRIGGVQAIAAMAYGTETLPRADIICGPGNLFVTLAKKLVYGDVGIDGLYGPTETVVIADDTSNPTLCAVDLLAQAEHDALARPVLITNSERLADAVASEVETRLARLDRGAIARASIQEQGCIALVDSVSEGVELANQFAPEHLCLMVADAWAHLGQVRNAGAVFIGEFSHEVLGDYVAGPSHVMPTAGTARFNSGLGIHSFVKISPVVALSSATSVAISGAASVLGRAEGLTAHAEAAEIREELF